EVLRLNPKNLEARTGLGQSLFSCQKLAEAEAELRKALRELPKDSEYYYWLGSSIGAQGRHEECVQFLRKSAELAPNDRVKQSCYLQELIIVKRYDDAISATKSAMGHIPGNSEIH